MVHYGTAQWAESNGKINLKIYFSLQIQKIENHYKIVFALKKLALISQFFAYCVDA